MLPEWIRRENVEESWSSSRPFHAHLSLYQIIHTSQYTIFYVATFNVFKTSPSAATLQLTGSRSLPRRKRLHIDNNPNPPLFFVLSILDSYSSLPFTYFLYSNPFLVRVKYHLPVTVTFSKNEKKRAISLFGLSRQQR